MAAKRVTLRGLLRRFGRARYGCAGERCNFEWWRRHLNGSAGALRHLDLRSVERREDEIDPEMCLCGLIAAIVEGRSFASANLQLLSSAAQTTATVEADG